MSLLLDYFLILANLKEYARLYDGIKVVSRQAIGYLNRKFINLIVIFYVTMVIEFAVKKILKI